MTISTGDIIKIRVLAKDDDSDDNVLACPSTYFYGSSLQLCPKEDMNYVVCNGNPKSGFMLSVKDNPDVPIGFAVMYVNEQPCYCITQVGYQPKPIEIEVVGKVELDEVPKKFPIGSQLFVVSY